MTFEMFKRGTSENFLLKQLVKKAFTSKYKDSVLGILWSFLNPLIQLVILTAIFSSIFQRSIPNFPVYFMTGRLTLDFFNHATKLAMNSIKSNRGILNKIFVPRYIFAVGGICSEFINFLITIVILIIIMFATNAPFYPIALLAIIPIITLVLLITGVGLILAIVATKFTDIKHLYTIFTSLLSYACAIFYPISIVPANIRRYMELNPIYGVIAQMRSFILYGEFPSKRLMLSTFALAMALFIIGIYVFRKYQDRITLDL